MRLYLDICVLKRPFDNQDHVRVRRETAAIFKILERVEMGLEELVWSPALTLENDADPDLEVRERVNRLKSLARITVHLLPHTQSRIEVLCSGGIPALDSAHLAFAESACADYLITTDDRLIRRSRRFDTTFKVLNPLEYLRQVHGHEPTR